MKRKISLLIVAVMVMTVFAFATPDQVAAASAPAKVKGMEISVGNTGSVTTGTKYKVVLKWKKAKNAKKYQVYRSTSLKGKYKRVKTTKSRNYKATISKDYYYKVRAVNGKKKGKFSTALYACRLKAQVTNIFNSAYGKVVEVTVNNPTNKSMYFWASAAGGDAMLTIADKKEKVVKRVAAYPCNASGIVVKPFTMNKKSSGQIYFLAYNFFSSYSPDDYYYVPSFTFNPGTSQSTAWKRTMGVATSTSHNEWTVYTNKTH